MHILLNLLADFLALSDKCNQQHFDGLATGAGEETFPPFVRVRPLETFQAEEQNDVRLRKLRGRRRPPPQLLKADV